MSFLNTKREVSCMSVIPSELSTEAVVEALHDHKRVFEASPLHLRSERCEASPEIRKGWTHFKAEDQATEHHWTTYRVEEKIPYYGVISFEASFQSLPDGMNSVVYAPTNLQIFDRWRVVSGESEERMLREDIALHGNVLTMPFVTMNILKAHKEMHGKMFKELQDRHDEVES